MSRSARLGVMACVVLAALACDVASAGTAARTRPPSGGGGSASPGRASGSATHGGGSHGSAPSHASGRATYGHGYGYGYGGYPVYPWYGGGYGWYDSYYPYWWWGGPYGAWGVWAWPGAYAVETVPVYTRGAEPPAVIVTEVSPGRATLRLDGEDVGRAKDYRGTWNQLFVSPGTHVLEFEADGYKRLRIAIDAKSGSSYRVEQALQKGEGDDPRSVAEPVPAAASNAASPTDSEPGLRTGRLRLEVVPADAAVYLDGEFLGSGGELARLHGALPVAAGEHTLDLVRPGFQCKSIQVVVPEGDPVPVRLELTEADREP